jgi:hypothetical protein
MKVKIAKSSERVKGQLNKVNSNLITFRLFLQMTPIYQTPSLSSGRCLCSNVLAIWLNVHGDMAFRLVAHTILHLHGVVVVGAIVISAIGTRLRNSVLLVVARNAHHEGDESGSDENPLTR